MSTKTIRDFFFNFVEEGRVKRRMKRKITGIQQRSFTNWVSYKLLDNSSAIWSKFVIMVLTTAFPVLSTALSRNAFYSGTPLIRPPLDHENREPKHRRFCDVKGDRKANATGFGVL